jgi:predicted NBD/HSP70 family sugar kinase
VPSRRTGTPSVIRAMNDRAALELMLEQGALSRSQLVELTGVSKPTASETLSRLVRDGLVVPSGTASGARGPSAQLYSVNLELAHIAGINTEEDRVSASVADLSGRVLGEASIEVDLTDGQSPVPVIDEALRAAMRRARSSRKLLKHVVLGLTGSYHAGSDSVIYAGHLPGWEVEGVVDDLRRAVRAPLTIENDANLAAIGERTRGSAKDADTFALLWVARGLGLAIELGGGLYQGSTGGAGEIGYMPVAGRSLTFQDSVGSGAVLQLARRYGIVGTTADEVVGKAVQAGDAKLPFLHELAERLATGVATIVAVLDPPMVVLAGATCQAGGQLLVDLTQQELRRISPFRTELVGSAVSGSPVLAGAVDLAVAMGRTAVLGAPGADPWTPAAPVAAAV